MLILTRYIQSRLPKWKMLPAAMNGIKDLTLFIDKEVSRVDFSIDHPGLALYLNSGGHLWTPVCVKKPHSIEKGESDFLSVQDLNEMDEVVFLSHNIDDTPGVVVKKGNLEVWTPVATQDSLKIASTGVYL